jgi:low affinity Fe/Cu permease
MVEPKQHSFEQAALKITKWIGSPVSVLVHTIIFVLCLGAGLLGFVQFEQMLLILTTIVSLEAIYLSLFIQMSVNMANQSIDEVEQNIDEIQKDVDEIQEDVDEIQEDVGEIQKDVDEIQEDVGEMSEDEPEEIPQVQTNAKTIDDIYRDMQRLMDDIKKLQR